MANSSKMNQDLFHHHQSLHVPALGWKARGKRRMRDSDNHPTLRSSPHAEDTLLPSFELADMLTTLTLDEPQHFQSASKPLHQTDYGTMRTAYSCKNQIISSSFNQKDPKGDGQLAKPLVEHKQVLANYQATMMPLLKSLFPRQVVQQLAPDSAETSEQQQENLSAAHLRFLIFGAINNFAGVDEPDLKMMYSYLSNTIHSIAEHTSKAVSLRVKLLDMPSAKPMAETFFRCAIEAGDAVAARSLLLWKEAGISANEQICVVQGRRYTPIERAASLQHTRLTQTLTEFGADVNKSFGSKSPCGALEYALSFRRLGTDINLISILLHHGGQLDCSYLKEALYTESSEVIQRLLSARIAEWHQMWMRVGVFHEAIYFCGIDVVKDLMVHMRVLGVNFDTAYKRKSNDITDEWESFAWETGLYPPHFVDIAAQRGEQELVELVLSFGGTVTNNSLPAAIRSGNTDLIYFVIEQGANVNAFSPIYRSTPFADALRSRNQAMFQLLGSSGFRIESCKEHSLCAILAAAAEIGDIKIVTRLLPVCSSRNALGWALSKAVAFDRTDVALVLLNAGAEVEQEDCVRVYGCLGAGTHLGPKSSENERYQATFPLHNALRHRNHVLVLALLNHDAKPVGDRDGIATPLETAVCMNDQEMIEALVSAGAHVKDRGDHARNLTVGPVVARAVQRKHNDCARFLVEAGADIHASSTRRPCESPLAAAIRNKDPDMISWLLENGAQPTDEKALIAAIRSPSHVQSIIFKALGKVQPGDGSEICEAVLTDAIIAGEPEILRFLLQLRPNIVNSPWMACTPLVAAVQMGDKNCQEMVQMLLHSGMSADDIGSWNANYGMVRETALLVAIETKRPSMIQFLLDQGANINRPANMGIRRTPLQKAAEVGSHGIVQLILNRGADVNAPPSARGGGTALQLAAMQGFIGIVELLLEWHADASMAGSIVRGRTAIQGAAEHGRFDMVKFLHSRCCIEPQQYAKAARLAKESGHNALSEMIRSFEADLRPRAAPNQAGFLHQDYDQGENAQLEDIQLVDGQVVDDQPEDQFGDDGAGEDEPEENRRTVCASCNASMSNISALRRHERTVHGTQSHLQCSECPRVFRRRDNLLRHQNTHRQPYQKLGFVICPSCSKSYRKDYLPQHQRACREGVTLIRDSSAQ